VKLNHIAFQLLMQKHMPDCETKPYHNEYRQYIEFLNDNTSICFMHHPADDNRIWVEVCDHSTAAIKHIRHGEWVAYISNEFEECLPMYLEDMRRLGSSKGFDINSRPVENIFNNFIMRIADPDKSNVWIGKIK